MAEEGVVVPRPPLRCDPWEEVEDAKTKKLYYWNRKTRQTKWKKPAGAPEGAPLPEGWVEVVPPASAEGTTSDTPTTPFFVFRFRCWQDTRPFPLVAPWTYDFDPAEKKLVYKHALRKDYPHIPRRVFSEAEVEALRRDEESRRSAEAAAADSLALAEAERRRAAGEAALERKKVETLQRAAEAAARLAQAAKETEKKKAEKLHTELQATKAAAAQAEQRVVEERAALQAAAQAEQSAAEKLPIVFCLPFIQELPHSLLMQYSWGGSQEEKV